MTLPITAPADVIAYGLWPNTTHHGERHPWTSALSALQHQLVMQQLARSRIQRLPDWSTDHPCCSHEWAYAQALGWSCPADLLPFAALAAQQHQLSCPLAHGWAFIDLVHTAFQQGQQFYSLPASLSEHESGVFLQAMQTYFQEDGIQLQTLAPGRYLAHGVCLKALPSKSLALVLQDGTHALDEPEPLANQSPAQRLVRRLQNEMQMLLYTHPLNEHRQQPVNSFWLSGTGDLPSHTRTDVKLHTDLQESYLAQQPQAWAQRWLQLAEAVMWPALVQGRELVLCAEQGCVRLSAPPTHWWQTLKHKLNPPSLVRLLS